MAWRTPEEERRARMRRVAPWQPYQPPPPPAGSYDPSLDAQQGAAQRGLFDLEQDVRTGNLRDTADYALQQEDLRRQYGWGREDLDRGFSRGNEDLDLRFQQGQRQYDRGVFDVNRGYGRGVEDLTRGFERGTADLDRSLGRGEEDYTRNVGLLERAYRQRARTQLQQQNAAGVVRGGAALQAARKRAENQAIERQPMDTGIARFREDIGTSRTRLGEDRDRSLGRMGEDRDLSLGRLGEDWTSDQGLINMARTRAREDYERQGSRMQTGLDTALGRLALEMAPPDAGNPFGGRRFQDRTTQLTRAQRENAAFGLDLVGQRAYQAAGAGWNPPGRGEPGGPPRNEFMGADGPYRVVTRGDRAFGYDPSGRLLWDRARRRRR